MALTGGDRQFGHGDEITATLTGSGASEGDLVYVSGFDTSYDRPEVSLADADGSTDYHGVIKLTQDSGGAAAGDRVTVVFHGTPWVRVGGSGAVAAGDVPAPEDSSLGDGEAGRATSGGSGDDVYLSDPVQLKDGNYYANVHIK